MGDFDFTNGDDTGDVFDLDLGDVEEWNYVDYSQPVPVGKWNARIEKVEIKKATTGSPMWAIMLTIEDEPWKEQGRQVRDQVVLHQKTLGSVKAFLQAALAREVTTLKGFNPIMELTGRPVIVALGQKVYNGKLYNEVNFYFKPGSQETGANEFQPHFDLGEGSKGENKSSGGSSNDDPF